MQRVSRTARLGRGECKIGIHVDGLPDEPRSGMLLSCASWPQRPSLTGISRAEGVGASGVLLKSSVVVDVLKRARANIERQ